MGVCYQFPYPHREPPLAPLLIAVRVIAVPTQAAKEGTPALLSPRYPCPAAAGQPQPKGMRTIAVALPLPATQ
jgi:hypothetical protein